MIISYLFCCHCQTCHIVFPMAHMDRIAGGISEVPLQLANGLKALWHLGRTGHFSDRNTEYVCICTQLNKGKNTHFRTQARMENVSVQSRLCKCAPGTVQVPMKCLAAQESFYEPVNNVPWKMPLGTTNTPTDGEGEGQED